MDRPGPLSFYDAAAVHAWSDAFIPGESWDGPLQTYAVSEGGVPLGFISFARRQIGRLKLPSLGGYYWPFRTCAVCADAPRRRAFAEAIADSFARRPPGLVFRMGPISMADLGVMELLAAFRRCGWRLLRRDLGQVFELALTEAPPEGASPSLLKNINYERRRLAKEHGAVVTERHVLAPGSDDLLAIVERIEAASWVAQRGGDPKFLGTSNRRFWTSLAEAGTRPSVVAIWVLRCGAEPVAFSLNFETATTLYIIANGYDERWKARSPGSILSADVISDARSRGFRHLDWGQGDSGYKTRWGATVRTMLGEVLLFHPGPRGALLFQGARLALRGWHVPPHV